MEATLKMKSGLLIIDGELFVIESEISITVASDRLIASLIGGRVAGITGWKENWDATLMTTDADGIGEIFSLTAIGTGITLTVRGHFF
jgi:hypothetical protein